MKIKKGIILAGGSAKRLKPLTSVISKHLLPIFNKPMIYYPLSTLMLGGIKDYLIITNPSDLKLYQNLLGNGSRFGIHINYKVQKKPEGLPQAFIIAEKFINKEPVCLNLGDHIFFGNDVTKKLKKNINRFDKTTIFSYYSDEYKDYGVINFNENNKPVSIIEKPKKSKSKLIVCGLYCYDQNVVEYSKELKLSNRGELEISDLNNIYLKKKSLNIEKINKSNYWIDAGTPEKMLKASNLISTLEKKNNYHVGCIEIIAFKKGFINLKEYKKLVQDYKDNHYGNMLRSIIN